MLDEPLSARLRTFEDGVRAPVAGVESTHHRDKLHKKMFLDDQQLTLQRYWRHEHLALYPGNKRDKTTTSALSAIKKSIRALVHKGGFRGRLPLASDTIPDPALQQKAFKSIVTPVCNRPVQSQYNPEEIFTEEEDDDDYEKTGDIMYQALPLKKRKVRRAQSFDATEMHGSETHQQEHYYSNADVENLMAFTLTY